MLSLLLQKSSFLKNVLPSRYILEKKCIVLSNNALIQQLQKFSFYNDLAHQKAKNDSKFQNINNNNLQVDEENLQSISKQYPEPKATLHNFYQILSQELKKQQYKLPDPQYKNLQLNKKSRHLWSCSYKLPWPEEIKVDAVAATKQEASKKAALKALTVLKRATKITGEGLPIIYDKRDRLNENKPIPIELNTQDIERLQNIINIYEKRLQSKMSDLESLTNVNTNFEIDPLESEVDKKYFERNSKDLPNLTITKFREEIVNAINQNQVVIIKGEPGCGKSTQVPQYIYDDWFENGKTDFCEVIVSEPRRIAATSLAERVSQEREEALGETVGYQVRLDSVYNKNSGAILYCTSGILLKRLQTDPHLKSATHVILDEAHERDVNTDLLMVLLKKALTANNNLKIVVMSATIDVDLFQKYFNNAPLIEIPGFSYPVDSYFLEDMRIRLDKTFYLSNSENPQIVPEDICKVINWIHRTKPPGAILCFLPGWDDISKVRRRLEHDFYDKSRLVLPLHSKLTMQNQKKIFKPAPPGVRKIILATNIAETSVTINDVVYVVDTGAHKEQRLDKKKVFECVDNYWISQANVNQRRGRAGRVRPGESYHLFTREKYNRMEQFQLPVILRVALTNLVLDSKVYNQNMKAVDFLKELPTPPDEQAVKIAVEELISLKILDKNENLTALGRAIALFSLPPSLSKALVVSYFFNCVLPIVDIITVLSLDSELFSGTAQLEDKSVIRDLKTNYSDDSDHLVYHGLLEEWRNIYHNNRRLIDDWCANNFLSGHKMNLLHKLRDVHLNYLSTLNCNLPISNKFSKNNELVKAILLAGLNNILYSKTITRKHQKRNILVSESNQSATITSDSINYKKKLSPSTFFCYSNEVHSITRRTMIVRETSVVQPLSLLLFTNLFQQKSINNLVHFVNERNSSLKFSVEKQQAELLLKVKDIVDNMIQYLCFCHLKSINLEDSDVYHNWSDILSNLNGVIRNNSLET